MAAKTKVLVVDDSLSVRHALQRALSDDPRIDVVGMAADGAEALERMHELAPDVITLDIRMPRMDGLETLKRIMETRPTPVIMVSSLTRSGARATVEALELGAVDFVLKPSERGATAVRPVFQELREKITASAGATVHADGAVLPPDTVTDVAPGGGRIVVIASSTGGPQALRRLLPALPADLAIPVIVVQHMPAAFTAALASSLHHVCSLPVVEAEPGLPPRPGRVLIAPGGVHLTIGRGGCLRLDLGRPESGLRPSANVTMESAAAAYGSGVLGVVLTGMGSDGTRGAAAIKRAGGAIIAEAESTAVIFGMPKSVIKGGYADQVLPLHRIAGAIMRSCEPAAV